jgi:hypothetical protein
VLRISLEQGQSGTPNRVYVETIETGMEFGVAERGLKYEMYDQEREDMTKLFSDTNGSEGDRFDIADGDINAVRRT